ncbi:MAG: O-methyltransferase [Bacilli bacterium]|nr:O-methyltransferase [Bacilli bacterium]
MVDNNAALEEIREYAEENNVPIMTEDGIKFLTNYIRKHNIKKILEIGAAIGYSAIMMALVDNEIEITTIERDEKRYLEAVKNIKKFKLENRINLIYKDAFDVKLDDTYDLLFIDAAKAQNIKFFEMFSKNLNPKGTIITDNMNFHGLVDKELDEIKSRNLRALIRKLKDYAVFLKENKNYETEFLDIGDGIAISIPR